MDKIAIGKRLLELREYIGLSRKSISDITHIPTVTIKAWENGYTTIKQDNLIKYLQELNKLGCGTNLEWVLGKTHTDLNVITCPTPLPRIINKSYSVELNDMLEIFKTAKNCFYFLDQEEEVIYLNPNLTHLLGKPYQPDTTPPSQTPFKNICSTDVYKICHERFMLCSKIKTQTFRYNVHNLYNDSIWDVDVVYHSIFKTKSTQFLGVFCLVLSQDNFLNL